MNQRRLIVIGGGPASLAAAIYAARAELKPLVFVGEKSGGQLMLTTEIENYPGFAQGILGPKLMMEMQEQAKRFGAEIREVNVDRVDFSPGKFKVNGETTEAVIIATGAESLTLGVPGETEYIGRGVSYCAVCDAAFFRDKKVVVVGGGDAAMEDTLALTKFATKIVIIHRRDKFKASKIMSERVLKSKKVEVWWNSEVIEVSGDPSASSGQVKLTGIKIRNNKTNKVDELPVEGVFVAIGHKPATSLFRGQIDLDEKGYIKTGLTYPFNGIFKGLKDNEHPWIYGYPTMTSVPGVFAAGDNVDFRYRQAATASGMGVMAALDAEWWLERRK